MKLVFFYKRILKLLNKAQFNVVSYFYCIFYWIVIDKFIRKAYNNLCRLNFKSVISSFNQTITKGGKTKWQYIDF